MLSNLPESVLMHTRKSVKEIYTKLDGISFITNKLSQCQSALTLLTNIVPFLEDNPYTEVSIYNLRTELPILTPHCGVYGANAIPTHIGPLIATDPQSFLATRLAQDARIFYYVFDVQIWRYVAPKELEYLRASNAILFTRSENHRKFLKKEFNIDTIVETVGDFQLDQIYQIIRKYTK